jgi:hypothetical protein
VGKYKETQKWNEAKDKYEKSINKLEENYDCLKKAKD